MLINQKIKEIVGDQPAVLTGDFNVSDQWDAYTTITTNSFVLKDAYKIDRINKEGVNYTFHDFGREPIDKREKNRLHFRNTSDKSKRYIHTSGISR